MVAGDVEPGAGVDKVRIPAPEHLVWIGQAPAKRVERVALGITTRRRYGGEDG